MTRSLVLLVLWAVFLVGAASAALPNHSPHWPHLELTSPETRMCSLRFLYDAGVLSSAADAFMAMQQLRCFGEGVELFLRLSKGSSRVSGDGYFQDVRFVSIMLTLGSCAQPPHTAAHARKLAAARHRVPRASLVRQVGHPPAVRRRPGAHLLGAAGAAAVPSHHPRDRHVGRADARRLLDRRRGPPTQRGGERAGAGGGPPVRAPVLLPLHRPHAAVGAAAGRLRRLLGR